jgi:hypothetical protein
MFKVNRILRVARQYGCRTFVESGTFYGQTVARVKNQFEKVISFELSRDLFELNALAFSRYEHIEVRFGDSADLLRGINQRASGRILFWLDGHYSGPGTALGTVVSPILAELDAIQQNGRADDCILIDDARLFTGRSGYPVVEEVRSKLKKINPQYEIQDDWDCIVAVPSIVKS